jgi:RNA polymerase sigma factor (sigma-70 family)
MDSQPIVKNEWVLTEEAFARLLAYLDADTEIAGEKYETAYRMLVKFFQWRGAYFPEELADETLNRVARKLEEGDEIRDFTNYCYGIARFVFLESLKRPDSRREELDDIAPTLVAAEPQVDEDEDCQYECFEGCLDTFPPENRRIILQYYEDEKRAKIDHRKELAESLGIPLNALRSRAQRYRDRLETCVRDCLEKKSQEAT